MLHRHASHLVRRPLAHVRAGARGSIGAHKVSARTFWGGAFDDDLEATRAKLRRSRLRSFLAALEQLPPSGMSAEQPLIVRTMTQHAGPDGSFRSREQ